jgi:hypothetical protein
MVPRVLMFCVLCLSIAAGVAAGSNDRERHARTEPSAHQARARFMFGDAAVGSRVAHTLPGRASAFRFRSSRSGTVTAISLYVGAHTRARILMAGLYANRSGHPGRALASRRLRSPRRGRWNTFNVSATPVKAGRTYWLAVLGAGGRLYLRARARGSCGSQDSRQRRLASLPVVWQTGQRRDSCRLSAYFRGNISSPPSHSGTTPPAGGSATPGGSGPPPPPPPSGGAGNGLNCAGAKGSGVVNQSSLDACGLPSMNTTGPAAGTTFTASSGFSANTAGQVYNGLNVNGEISINASNVTIQNSNITAVDPDTAAIKVAKGVTGVKIVNDSIHGTNAVQSGSLAFAVSYFGSSISGVTIDHTNFYNGDRILAGYGTVTNSYCLGGAKFNSSSGSEEHDECIYTDGAAPGIRAIHDTLLVDNVQTAAIFVDNPDYGGGGVDGILDVENSILAGGGYCIYGGDGTNTPHTGSVTIKDNRFSRIFYSKCGQYGTDAHVTESVTTWSGNVWDDTNSPVSR